MKFLEKTRLAAELKRLAKENAAQGKPLTVMNDVVFKAMLTSDSDDSREALRCLLSACTRREVASCKILNSELLPAHLAAKSLRLDVRVSFNDGELADLEMQMGVSGDDLKKRSAFYSAMLLSGQGKRGEPYGDIKRVYQIFFLNAVLFPDSTKFPRRYQYREEIEHDQLTDVTNIIFYELPKLEKQVQALLDGDTKFETLKEEEKWGIFLRYWHEQRAAPLIEKLCEEEGIMRAGSALTKVDRDLIKFSRRIDEMKNNYELGVKIRQFQIETDARLRVEAEARGEQKGQQQIIKLLKSGKSPEEIIREFEQ